MFFYTFIPKLLNMSLTAGVAIVLVLLLRLLLKKAPKVISYALWGIVLFRLLCPVSVGSSFSLYNLFDAPTEEAGMMTSVIEYVPGDIVHAEYPSVALPVPGVSDVINEALPQGQEQLAADPLEAPMAIATYVWMAGMLIMIIYSVVSYIRLRRRLSVVVPLRENIFIADDIKSPFVVGLFRPKIYLPCNLREKEQEYIILHEQHHIRRLDHIGKALAFLALAIHWFNPLVWVAFILASKDMEMSCDEAVIRKVGSDVRADYSASLLTLATGRRMIAGTPLAFGEGDTKERINNLSKWKKPAVWVVILAVIVCMIVAVCFLTNPKQDRYTLRIVVPAGSQEEFAYTDEEVSTVKNSIKIWAGDGLGDTEVMLAPANETTEAEYAATYLTPGLPVEFDAEKDTWFKIGVNMQNPTNEDIMVYVEVENVEVRIVDERKSVIAWFDYTENPSAMEDESTINLPIYPDVTFSYNQTQIIASRSSDTSELAGHTILITGMPIWNAYFCDLTGDGLPELCSTISWGSGMIDNRVIIYDYANGVSYELSDRGYFDFTLRQDHQDGLLYVDKTTYHTDELVETGRLVFKDHCIQIEGFSNEAHQVFQAEILEIHDGKYLVKPVEGSWERNRADRMEVPIRNAHPSPEPEIGDVIEIEYAGEILETDPAQIAAVYGIRVIEENKGVPRLENDD